MDIIDHDTGLPVNDSRFAFARRVNGSDSRKTSAGAPGGLARAYVWLLLALLYFIMPDFIPGPIDDIIVNAVAIANLMREKYAAAIPQPD